MDALESWNLEQEKLAQRLISEENLARGRVWPGAMARTLRNRFVEQWAGREWALRQQARGAAEAIESARMVGDVEHIVILIGQDAGLIDSILRLAR